MEIALRPWQESDLRQLIKLANNKRIADFMTDGFPHPYNEEAGRKFIAMASGHDPVRIMAITADNNLAGGVGLHPASDISRMNAELGYWIAEPFWNKGIATAAVSQMVKRGFELFEFTRIFARPFGHNKASQRVLTKCGFVHEATIRDGFIKNGQYCDELIYALRREAKH